MAGRKEFELLFKLQAALGSGFNSSFSGAINTTKQLQSTLTKINSLTGKIDGYKRQSEAVENSRKKLALLTEEHEKLQQEMSATENPSDSLKKKFERNEKQIAATTAKITEQEQKLDSLGKELQEAGIETGNLGAANDKLSKSYERVKKSQEQLAKISAEHQKTAAAISATKGQIAKSAGVIAAGGAALYATAIKPAIEFESAFAGVKKTINGTPEQLLTIQNGIRKMATEIPLSVVEISAIAEAAGQLGIKTDSILGFTRVMSDLGVATNLVGDEAASTLAKFANITGMPQENFDRLGSTIVALGNNLATTEADIAAMGLRLAGAGKQVGMTEAQILSFSGALSSVGIEAEAGGSAFSKVMISMQLATETGSKDLQSFAKVAGMSANDFKKAFQTDAASAMTSFIKGLSESEKKGVSAIKVLDDMGITETRMRDALLRAAGASDVFTNALDLGSAAWKENTALQKEAEQRYATTESLIQIMKQSFNDVGISIGKVFTPEIAGVITKVTELVKKFSAFVEANPEVVKTVAKVAAGLAGLNLAGLGLKLGFLEVQSSVQGFQKVLAIFGRKTAEAGVAAATNSGKLATLGKSVSGYFGGVKNSLGGLGGSIDKVFGGKLGTVFSKIGNGISGSILKPLGSIGNKIGGVMGGVGGKITGAFGGVFGKIGGAIVNGPMGKIGGVFKSLGGVAGSVLGPAVNGLGGAFSGLFGKVMPIIAIISLLSMLFVKLSGGDISGFIEPLKQAFEQMKPVLQSVMQQFSEMGKQILPLLMDAAKQLAPLFGQIVTAILPVILQLIQQLVPLFIQIVQTVLPVILDLLTQLAPLFTNIITAILPVIVQLMQMLLPIITQLITSVLPIVVQLLSTIVPIISQIINAILPVLLTLLQALMPVIQFVADLFSNVLGAAIQMISGIIGGLMQVLQGIIDFITGVFTGNWTQAWEGIKNIFGGIWDAILSVCKGVINGITSAINVIIKGLNCLKIPDWVPGIGGAGINIPLIPQLAKGSNFTPDTFIAGEKGAELVTNARGRKVFTAAQTGSIFGNIAQAVNAVRSGTNMPGLQLAYAGAAAGGISAPSVHAAQGGASVVIHSAPVFNVGSDAEAQDIEEALRKRDEKLLNEVDERLRKKKDDERRGKYD